MDVAARPFKTAPIAAASSPSGSGDFRDQAREDIPTAAHRLVIEEGPKAGSFIYKTLDRVTGEVIRQLPREQLVEMMESETYASGSVIDTVA